LIGATLNDWNSEYVIFEGASGKRKVHRSNFFPHRGWTHKKQSNPYATKVLTLEQVLEKEKRYFQALAKTNKTFKEKEKKQKRKKEPQPEQPVKTSKQNSSREKTKIPF